MTRTGVGRAAAAAAMLGTMAAADAACAQEAAGPRPSPPAKMVVPGERAPARFGGGTVTGATKLSIKNTTRDPVACRLAVRGAPGSRTLTFGPGQEFSEDFPITVEDIALVCPQLRRAAFSPLLLGSRYVFLRLEGAPQLVEVAPPDPR